MAIAEPAVETYLNRPIAKYVAATRPPFLLAALVPCLIGLATAWYDGIAPLALTAVLTSIGALLVHAGVNVLNDYYDALNGTDAANKERIYPFTGGSRFIQNGVLSERETAVFGSALFVASTLIGVVLLPYAGWGLVGVGLVGLLLGWAYSAPPLALNSHGLGEISVALGFGFLIPLGADMVQRGAFDTLPLLAAAPYALLVAGLLYINQFPDWVADAAAGKHHWVVRLRPRRARWGYLGMVLVAYGALLLMVWSEVLPATALLGLLGAPLSLRAAMGVLRHAERPAMLAPAIQLTIAAMLVHGVGLSVGLVLAA
ncbi:MAG: prenyltransferase [Thiohalomonadaceae bacterium]